MGVWMGAWVAIECLPGLGSANAPLVNTPDASNVLQPARAYAGLFAGADAFVLPTHGEGWGRPIVEVSRSHVKVKSRRQCTRTFRLVSRFRPWRWVCRRS